MKHAMKHAAATATLASRPLRYPVALAAALLVCAAPQLARAQAPAAPTNPTDASVLADHQGYQRQQGAISDLNDSGHHPLASYSMAKAQCWLDVSFHEYTRQEDSTFVAEALGESARITGYLAAGSDPQAAANPAWQTPLVGAALRLRDDLWRRATALHQGEGARCAAPMLACAEVELVHAGHEHQQQGWRHARPYIQMAEDLVANAEQAARQCQQVDSSGGGGSNQTDKTDKTDKSSNECQPTMKVLVRTCTADCRAVVPAKPPTFTIRAGFEFGKGSKGDIRLNRANGSATRGPAAASEFEQEVAQVARDIAQAYESIRKIEVSGHTDRLGARDLNVRLSRQRAETVLQILQAEGLSAERYEALGKGPAEPLPGVECAASMARADLIECLAPNRRVEVRIDGVRRPSAQPVVQPPLQCGEPVEEKR
jgi:outer membrane protein OmpA-like peptidoglycan-associated protein